MSNVFRKISHVFLRKSLNFIRSLGSNSGWVWRLWKQKVHHRCSVRTRARNSLLCLRGLWTICQRYLKVNWDLPRFFCFIKDYSALLHRWALIFDSQIHYSNNGAQWGLWKAEETIRENILCLCRYCNIYIAKHSTSEEKSAVFWRFFSLIPFIYPYMCRKDDIRKIEM